MRDVLGLPAMRGSAVLAGGRGLDRLVRFVNIMEVPEVLRWTRDDELLLTTGYPLRSTPEALEDFVAALDDRHLAGLAVKLGRYLDALPSAMLSSGDPPRPSRCCSFRRTSASTRSSTRSLTEVLGRQAATLARGEQAHSVLPCSSSSAVAACGVVAALPVLIGGKRGHRAP